MDEIDRALSDLRRAVLGRGQELTELSGLHGVENSQSHGPGRFQQQEKQPVGLELGPELPGQGMPISEIDRESPAPKIVKSYSTANPAEAAWTAEIEPRLGNRDSIEDARRPVVEENKSPQSPIRRLLDRLKRAVRWHGA